MLSRKRWAIGASSTGKEVWVPRGLGDIGDIGGRGDLLHGDGVVAVGLEQRVGGRRRVAGGLVRLALTATLRSGGCGHTGLKD
jgi:hypothetical protein